MFASFTVGVDPVDEWTPSAEQRAQLRADDDDCVEFELPRGEPPGALAALVFENTDVRSQSDAELVDSIAGLDRLASWAQAMQSRAIAELATRRPPAWVHDDGVDDFETVSRYLAEEIACALSLTVLVRTIGWIPPAVERCVAGNPAGVGTRRNGLAASQCHR